MCYLTWVKVNLYLGNKLRKEKFLKFLKVRCYTLPKPIKVKIRITPRWARYFKENWGVPFIIAFQVLLISAAGYRAYGQAEMANQIAIYAYYALVIGVVLQLVSYLRYGESGE